MKRRVDNRGMAIVLTYQELLYKILGINWYEKKS